MMFSKSQLQAFMVVKHHYAYYPSSVEYGYKGKKGHVKVAGQYTWADKAIRQNQKSSLKKVVDSLNDSIDELL